MLRGRESAQWRVVSKDWGILIPLFLVRLVSHVVHGGTAASVSGVISCSGSRWVSVGEGVMMTIMMMVGRGWRRGSGVVVEVMGHVSWCHVSGMEHVGLRLRGWWLRDAVERRWRVAEALAKWVPR